MKLAPNIAPMFLYRQFTIKMELSSRESFVEALMLEILVRSVNLRSLKKRHHRPEYDELKLKLKTLRFESHYIC